MQLIDLSNGFTATIDKLDTTIPALALLPSVNDFTEFWTAKVGRHTFYIGSGYKGEVVTKAQRKQKVVWYPNGRFWSGYGLTFKQALDGAIVDAWKYMD